MAPRFSTLSLVMSLSAALSAFGGPPALAQMASSDPMVGGAAMYPSRTIVENAVNSRDHTTLVAAVKAAGLVGTLSGRGPFTVFAPTNEAFARLPTGAVEMLLRPANKPELVKVLTYHVVAGRHSAQDLMGMAASGRSLTTVEGEPLKVMNDGGKIVLVDAHGGRSTVTIADVFQSNGVIQVVDAVLMP
jgi:uncharacterized surface protein with fasciclin (FAS1) repeats